jgi:hypothetical protein
LVLVPIRLFLGSIAEDALLGAAAKLAGEGVETLSIARNMLALSYDTHDGPDLVRIAAIRKAGRVRRQLRGTRA